MAKPHGLLCRNGWYYIQRRFPRDVAELAGCTHWKRSLATSDRAEAIRRRNLATIEFDQLCEHYRSEAKGKLPKTTIWTIDQARLLIRNYVREQSTQAQADYLA